MDDVGRVFLEETLARLRSVRALGEGAMAQLSDEALHAAPDAESNSVAVLVQHLHGNMISRWAGFPGADGESPARDRDAEFVDAGLDRAALEARWAEGWSAFLGALERLRPDELTRPVTVRGESMTALGAIQRQVAHAAGHVYQIVYLAKLLRGDAWRTLSIPRGGSRAFNDEMRRRSGG